ncbi:MAG TPA: very short patch repair endonuclease [Candidatus Brocadiia bacterium]|nr:very short patch repair endonuclease [Candidatus Brocadiia bacterium]
MARVKGKNTKPEKVVRSLLHKMGYRFRLHVSSLPGNPDIVLPRHRKIVFVNGCFWHGHKKCRKGALPKSNPEFWAKKLAQNVKRDVRVRRQLRGNGWRILTLWECEVSDRVRTISRLESFIRS